MSNACIWGESNVQRIQRKYEEIDKRNKERLKTYEMFQKKLQNDFNVHKFKLKYLEKKKRNRGVQKYDTEIHNHSSWI